MFGGLKKKTSKRKLASDSECKQGTKRVKTTTKHCMVWSPAIHTQLQTLIANTMGNELECRLRFVKQDLARLAFERLQLYMTNVLHRIGDEEQSVIWIHPSNGYRRVEVKGVKPVEMTKTVLGEVKWSVYNDPDITFKCSMAKETLSWSGPALKTFEHECYFRIRNRATYPLGSGAQLDLTKVTMQNGTVQYEIECETKKMVFWESMHEWLDICLQIGVFRSREWFVDRSICLYTEALQLAPTISMSHYGKQEPLVSVGRIVPLPSLNPQDYVWMSTFQDAKHFFVSQIGSGVLYPITVLPAQQEIKAYLCKHKLSLLCYPLHEQMCVVDVRTRDNDSVYHEHVEALRYKSDAFRWITDEPSFSYETAQQRNCINKLLNSVRGTSLFGCPKWETWVWVDWIWDAFHRTTYWVVRWEEPRQERKQAPITWPKRSAAVQKAFLTSSNVKTFLGDQEVQDWIASCLPSVASLVNDWIITKEAPSDGIIRELLSEDAIVWLEGIKKMTNDPNETDSVRKKLIAQYPTAHSVAHDEQLLDFYRGWIEQQPSKIKSISIQTLYALQNKKINNELMSHNTENR